MQQKKTYLSLLLLISILYAIWKISQKVMEEGFDDDSKNIFIMWLQGFDQAPHVVKKCLESWKMKNPSWNVIELDETNLHEYINIEKEIPNIKNKNITHASYSDIVRIFLLEKYGGCWVDATTFCNKPLDKWLPEYKKNGFFAFEKPTKNKLLSSWFIACDKDNYIIQTWKKETIQYWKHHDTTDDYFWFHHLFGNLYENDNSFKQLWDLVPKMSANGPHFLQHNGFLNKISSQVKDHIDNIKTPLYKLTHKYNKERYNDSCNLSYVLQDSLKDKNFKKIFIIWFQGYDNMPEICKLCYKSWIYHNPTWNIHFIDETNITDYIGEKKHNKFKMITPIQCYADAVRLELIHKHGGLYIDSTIYCTLSLDKWLKQCLVNDTYVQWDFDSTLPSINFLFSNKINNNYFKINFELSDLDSSYHKINKFFYKNVLPIKPNLLHLQNTRFGKSSNNTDPKQGVKIMTNFNLMKAKTDMHFKKSIKQYPYFKLTYKNIPSRPLHDIFDKNTRFNYLISLQNESKTN